MAFYDKFFKKDKEKRGATYYESEANNLDDIKARLLRTSILLIQLIDNTEYQVKQLNNKEMDESLKNRILQDCKPDIEKINKVKDTLVGLAFNSNFNNNNNNNNNTGNTTNNSHLPDEILTPLNPIREKTIVLNNIVEAHNAITLLDNYKTTLQILNENIRK